MSIEKLVAHCEYNGKLYYQQEIDEKDKKYGQYPSYCLVEADKCPYHKLKEKNHYCILKR